MLEFLTEGKDVYGPRHRSQRNHPSNIQHCSAMPPCEGSRDAPQRVKGEGRSTLGIGL